VTQPTTECGHRLWAQNVGTHHFPSPAAWLDSTDRRTFTQIADFRDCSAMTPENNTLAPFAPPGDKGCG
jgi:hypothetical protein